MLHHAYSEPVLSWVYGENSGGSGTQAARHKLESDKLVDTAELEALATILVKKNFIAAGLALKTPMSPVVAPKGSPSSPAYLEESFEVASLRRILVGIQSMLHHLRA